MSNLTYKDFKIGQVLICVKLDCVGYTGGEEDNERLIIGEKYIVEDTDFHFPNKVCVKLKGPYYKHTEFVPIECFVDVSYNRDFKIDQILKK